MSMWLQIEAGVVASVARVAVRLLPLPGAVRMVRRLAVGPCVKASETDCHHAARQAAKRFAHPTCLYRAVVAYALLSRRFPDVKFHLGAATGDGFAAHAWTTMGGRATDQEAAGYSPLWTES